MSGEPHWTEKYFKTPSERLRNLFIIGAGIYLAQILLLQALGPLILIVAVLGQLLIGLAITIPWLIRRANSERSSPLEHNPWSHWSGRTEPGAPGIARQAFVLKAGRYYAVAFAPDEVHVSPRFDSRRAVNQWVDGYVNGSPNATIEHSISHQEIISVEVADKAFVAVSTEASRYVFDSWYNRFDGPHHEELKELVERLALSETRSGTQWIFRRSLEGVASSAPTSVSCGGGANMYDVGAGHARQAA